ncbi:hypothetical protein ACQ9Y2_27125 [Pseudomonas palleroniana]
MSGTVSVTSSPSGVEADYIKQKIEGYGVTVTSVTLNSDGTFSVVVDTEDLSKYGLSASMLFSEINMHNVKITPR